MVMSSNDLRDILWGDSEKRTRTVIIILFLIACIAYLVAVRALGIETEVIRDRYANAETIFSGVFPVVEYPPLILVFIAIPRLFCSTPWGYETAYVAQMFVFMVIGLLITSRMAGSAGFDRRRAMIGYAILTLLMLEFVLDRYDMIVMVFTLASFMLFLERRYDWAFVLLAAGTLLKIYPAMFLPIYTIFMIREGRTGQALRGFCVFILTGLAVVAVCLVLEPGAITGFLGYNGNRPLQIESVAASLIYPFSMVGLTDAWIQPSTAPGSFLSDNLIGPIPDAVAEALLPLLVVAVAGVWFMYILLCRRENGNSVGLMCLVILACLLMFLVVNKVFSAQYVIWLIGPVLCVSLLGRGAFSRRMFGMLVAVFILTQLNFAYNIGYLGGGTSINDLGMIVILVRNLAVIAMLWLTVREMFSAQSGDLFETSRQC